VDAFAIRNHLADVHYVDWADDLDADRSHRLHAYLHADRPVDHGHAWSGNVADPQPPMRSPR
jgi:hypothetical protein